MKTAAVAAVFALCLPAQKPGSAEELLIRRLANPDAAAADAAMVDLIRGGAPNASVLRKALELAKDPQVRARAERALAICAVDAPVEHGVKIGLRADRTEVKPGELVTLTGTVCNVSDAPIALFLGMSYSGNVFENGLALQRVDRHLEGGGEQARFGSVGFCGTGAQALVEVVPPWSSREFLVRGEYLLQPRKDTAIQHDGPHLAMNYVFLPLDRAAGGKVELRLHWAVDPATAGGMVAPKVKPDWKGTIRSNPIELCLRPAR